MRRRPRAVSALISIGFGAFASEYPATAVSSPARTSVIDLDATTPAAEPAPTEAAWRALRTFDGGHWSDAAIELQRVASGETGDAKPMRQLAQFDLATALYRLKLFQASFAVFSEITSDPSHPMFKGTLPWLGHLSEVLPEPADVIERVGKYSPSEIARFAGDDDKLLYSKLNYLLGRYDYSARNFEDAIACFNHVSKGSPHYVEAKFFTGVSNVALRQSAPAVQAFLEVEGALDEGVTRIEEPGRMRDLGYLSLARTYYSASVQENRAGVLALDATKLSAAVNYWKKIDQDSEYWLDAQFEASWARFMAGDSPRAMGNIYTLESPYFVSGLYPEADVLKAVVYYANCQYPEATTVAFNVKSTYGPLRKKLQDVYAAHGGDDADARFLELAGEVRDDKAGLDPDVAPLVKHAIQDRALLRSLEYVSLLDGERQRLSKMSPEFRSAQVASDVADTIDLAKAVAIKKAGTLAKDRLQRAIGELDQQLENAQKVLFDVADARRAALEADMRTIGGRPVQVTRIEGIVQADDEHEIWPFDGEYWRDELGTYRQEIISKCR